MVIIIGREEGNRRLRCSVAGGRTFFVGQPGSVPMSVSREHCRLTVDGGNITIENRKLENQTFVDGVQIFCKSITSGSRVQLSRDHYELPLQQILQTAAGNVGGNQGQMAAGQTFSLRPLESVWNAYQQELTKIQREAAHRANMQRLTGILSMSGCLLAALPVPGIFRVLIVALALGISIYFFFQGEKDATIQEKIQEVNNEYADKYKCPNPQCGKPFGTMPYIQVKFQKQCFACGCKYTN